MTINCNHLKMWAFIEIQPWLRGACAQEGPLWSQGQVCAQRGCAGELAQGPVQNQVPNLPYKCHLKLVGVIRVEAVLLTGVLLRNTWTPAFVSCRSLGDLCLFPGVNCLQTVPGDSVLV